MLSFIHACMILPAHTCWRRLWDSALQNTDPSVRSYSGGSAETFLSKLVVTHKLFSLASKLTSSWGQNLTSPIVIYSQWSLEPSASFVGSGELMGGL